MNDRLKKLLELVTEDMAQKEAQRIERMKPVRAEQVVSYEDVKLIQKNLTGFKQ